MSLAIILYMEKQKYKEHHRYQAMV